MKAPVYEGPRKVVVKEMPDAKIEKPTDVLVKITTTNICGSDLHMYEGRTNMETGRILGHENLGVVAEVGKGVERIAGRGPYSGGQAEYLRVPFGDFNCLVLPPDAEEKENDYVMLSDIFPTGYHAAVLAGVEPGDSVVIYGAGPVGLMAALSASINGASRVMVVDTHADRLALAERLGAIPIDDSDGSSADQVMELTGGEGADRGCECVGYHCSCKGHEVPNATMNNLIKAVRPTGGIGVVGVFVAEDPKAEDTLAKKGQLALNFGQLWMKGQHIASGQANVKAYNRKLCDLIAAGKAKPSEIISHQLPLEKAAEGYAHFDARDEGWTKVVLKA
ncbi:Threonine dehydrogenase [Caballeronia arationis]|uniref:Threonine dehydrogenase n=1 Tax=Caballeronia arationis TaxID=1777142 RepID=A0A7Z7I796_9BURK|nr:glutathione-independent formaldehyde dehydrogenase [Caballeronia arationis]SOE80595.1 Threonine dehydrogenase [Caballeronia arationis]